MLPCQRYMECTRSMILTQAARRRSTSSRAKSWAGSNALKVVMTRRGWFKVRAPAGILEKLRDRIGASNGFDYSEFQDTRNYADNHSFWNFRLACHRRR